MPAPTAHPGTTFGDLWTFKTTKNARDCVCVVCIVSVSEISKSGIVLDSDESSTSVPPFHTIYTIGTQKTERGGHQGHPEARKSKAVRRRICLVDLQAGLAITFLRLSTRFLASSRVLSILTRTTVPTIAYGRSLRTEISTLTGRGGHTAHHCKVPQSETHTNTLKHNKSGRNRSGAPFLKTVQKTRTPWDFWARQSSLSCNA